MATPAPAPFERLGPEDAPTPLVVAVPHAGRFYPPELWTDTSATLATLQRLEDRWVDSLLSDVLARGAVVFVATYARAWIDLNRAPDEVEVASRPLGAPSGRASARVRDGLGLIPSRLGEQPLRHGPPTAAEVAQRVARVHAPYHQGLAAALAAARRRHGRALLLDLHSMPSLRGANTARWVVGDRHGRSAGDGVAAMAMARLAALGERAACNHPYAGAYTLDRHGEPSRGIDALQLEVDRTLYLDSAGDVTVAGVRHVSAVVAAVASSLLSPASLAAE